MTKETNVINFKCVRYYMNENKWLTYSKGVNEVNLN